MIAAISRFWILLLAVTVLPLSADDAPNFLVAGMRVVPRQWDKEANLQVLEKYAREASAQGVKLLVTCEGFLDGYTSNPKMTPDLTRDKFFAFGEKVDGPILDRVASLAAQYKIHLAVGFAERRGNKMFNSVLVFNPNGDRVLHYSKTHNPRPDAEPFNTLGNHFPVVSTPVGQLGALVCYDRRMPEAARILAIKGAQIIIIPGYGTDGDRNEALLRTRAWENSVYVMWVKQNQVLIINPSGKIIARDDGNGDQLVTARVELNDQVGTGDIRNRTPAIYREILQSNPVQSQFDR